VLVLVLEHHAVDEPVEDERRCAVRRGRFEALEHRGAHAAQVSPAPLEVRKRERATRGARVFERIVHPTQTFSVRPLLRELLEEPHLLEVSDVPEIPYDRTHERVVLRAEVALRQRADEELGARAGLGEEVSDLCSRERPAGVEVHGIAGDEERGGVR
jgi:hypothetical protein